MARAQKIEQAANEVVDPFDGFPPEAFAYDDEVTPSAVESVRKRAAAKIDAEKWVVIDGYGPNHPF